MEAGIVGLSYIGKTTLFNALTALGVSAESSASKPNIGIVQVPDPRLERIASFIPTKKIVPATIQLVDVAGLVAGASEGRGAGNRFLAHLRNVDALVHVVRCFEDADVPHVHGRIDPVSDVEEVETELMLADLEVVENSMKNAERKARTGDREATARLALMKRCEAALSEGQPISSLRFDDAERRILRSISLLSAKPVLYVANVGEQDLAGDSTHAGALRAWVEQRGGAMVSVCAKLEAELVELDESERSEMLEAMGLAEPALNVLARGIYDLLGLQSFFTAGPKEVRAWAIPKGATAPEAAGEIHSDLQRGFIRVEVYAVDELKQYGSEKAIKEAGRLRVEGKNYVIREGDVCHFLFNV